MNNSYTIQQTERESSNKRTKNNPEHSQQNTKKAGESLTSFFDKTKEESRNETEKTKLRQKSLVAVDWKKLKAGPLKENKQRLPEIKSDNLRHSLMKEQKSAQDTKNGRPQTPGPKPQIEALFTEEQDHSRPFPDTSVNDQLNEYDAELPIQLLASIASMERIPRIEELTEGMDFELLDRPGGFNILKHDIIYRLAALAKSDRQRRSKRPNSTIFVQKSNYKNTAHGT
ncbi:hypothetical protein AB6A40_007233 [Gnathostoma spinigerum]|uniref:Uncharacterized protein n=1 Tax=Gnathostoma spinigerum TaxID=75299 RepID=A0ABD6ETA5_9BILA